MKLLMTIPIEIQADLARGCEPASPRYRMLKNGLIETDENGKKVVKVLCELEQAKGFLAWANEQRPDSAALIIVTQAPEAIN